MQANRHRIKGRRGNDGFSMIELMTVVCVGTVVMMLAAPSLTNLVRKTRVNSISSAVASSMRQARGEAIKLNRHVLVCAANAAGTGCAASTDWGTRGWLSCYDQNVDAVCDASTAELSNPITVAGAVDAALATVAGPAIGVSFSPTGSANAASAVTVTGAWPGATPVITTVYVTGSVKASRL